MRCWLTRAVHILLIAASPCVLALAQKTPAPQSAPPGYTLHVGTRIVLTDVTVTDKHGNPVQGLSRSAFQILDNGQAQQIASFVEHTSAEAADATTKAAPGEFSNRFLQHPPPAFNVLLLDTTTIHIQDQMYLADQLKQYLANTPPEGLLAVYTRAGDTVVQLQNFTNDPALLRAAIMKAIPHLQQPGSWAASDLDTLQQMVSLLRPYPGRKNLLWFNGGSNLALLTDASQLSAFVDMRPVYDALETSRIAVYPVDARGLTVAFSNSMIWQHAMMNESAESTGGQAYFNTNGLKQAVAQVTHNGEDFYTLTYDPHRQNFDNKWHKVKVIATGSDGENYTLSYRRGYYDDGTNVTPRSGQRTALQADGTTHTVSPDVLKTPLLISATVLPFVPANTAPGAAAVNASAAPAPKKNQSTYNIHITLPAADLVQTGTDSPKVALGTGILAVNRLGSRVARQLESLQIGIDPKRFHDNPHGTVSFDEQLNLAKGENFLYIVVWDKNSGRFGIIQAPVDVLKRTNGAPAAQ